jgi:hypothetical protein
MALVRSSQAAAHALNLPASRLAAARRWRKKIFRAKIYCCGFYVPLR